MSKENVALFVRMTATKRDISTRASSERSTQQWIELGKEVGLSFDADDVVGFVSEVTGKRVSRDNAVQEFLAEMTSSETVGARAPIQYTANLQKQLVRAGYTPPGGIGGATYTFPPDDSKQPSAPSYPGIPGGIKQGGGGQR
jgi:hypothetical protein